MLLHDPITGEPRLLAPNRAKRLGPRPEGCPFCVGNEESTPPEIDRLGSDDGAWQARVVPNLFPLADVHEVIIMSSRHVTSVRELTADEWRVALELWCRRLHAHYRERVPDTYVHLFVNDGKGAGASLEHTHAQLVALPRTPAVVDLTLHARKPECALCAAIQEEHIIWQDDGYVLRASEAPRIAGNLLLYPIDHETSIQDVSLEQLARACVVACQAVGENDFNMWLVQEPDHSAHWYIELVPRVSIPAGVELALGIGVSTMSPSQAAQDALQRLGAPAHARR